MSLTKQDIAAVVAERTGIPVGRLRQSDRERLLSLRETLSARVIGQQAAVDAVCTARAARPDRSGRRARAPPRPFC
ncbi:MAG: hypothetical protein ACLUFI_07380 [Oscillospiraceae bacterium]